MFICDIFMFFIDVVFGVCKIYVCSAKHIVRSPRWFGWFIGFAFLFQLLYCVWVGSQDDLVEVKEVVEKYIFWCCEKLDAREAKKRRENWKKKKRKKDYGIIYKIKRPFNKVADEKQISKSLSHKYLKELIQKILNLKHEWIRLSC